MRKVRIDFAPPSVRRAIYRAPRGAWSLVVIALVLLPNVAGTAIRYRDLARESAQLEAQSRARTHQAEAALAPVKAAAPVPEAQANAVNAAVLQLNLPWRALHDAIQAATPPGIALLALEPDAKKSSMRITAEAKSSDDMIAYVAQLQGVDWFSTVLLARHEINEQDPNRPIRFQIDAQWKAAQ